MRRNTTLRRGGRAFVAALVVAHFLAACVIVGSTAYAQQPADAEVIATVKDFAQAKDAAQWLSKNTRRLTPEFLAAVLQLSDQVAERANQTGNPDTFRFVQIAKLLAANGFLRQGDRRNALRAFIGASDVEFMLADSTDTYEHVRTRALDSAASAADIAAPELAFRARLIAADASYEASILKGLNVTTRMQWEHAALVDLMSAAQLVDAGKERMWLERFVSLSGVVLTEAYSKFGYGGDEDEKIAALKQLTTSLQTAVPVDFSYQVRPNKDWKSDTRIARLLAALSYSYGDATMAGGRLRYAAAVARSHNDGNEVAISISQLYETEKRLSSNPAQLSDLRAEVRTAATPLREAYRSRAGRLWASARADTLLGQLTRDDLSAGTKFADAFDEIEALKARLLLDQLTVPSRPLNSARDQAAAVAIERELLAFPACSRSHDDMFARELLLLSRMSLATEFTREEDGRRVSQVEAIYQGASAGFEGVASPPPVAEVQAALKPDEAIIEYFIPYYELHPAIDLWVLVVTRNRTAVAQIPLDRFLPKGGDIIGSLAVDSCPPLDASPLGNAVAGLRFALQTTDETKADAQLRAFHGMLIEPVIKAGFDPTKFRQWIIVPHGPLHYVPFAALIDRDSKFLIQQVALSTSPSSALWLREQSAKRPPPSSVGGLFAPVLANPQLPPLPASKRETTAILARYPASRDLLFSGAEASSRQLREIAPKADILHISTHGDFPELYAVDQHAVLLSHDGAEDGRLTAADIRTLDLRNTALVVLAVCNGGLYNVGPSDEPYGLVPAFLVAGATNVLGTLWPIEDEFGRRFVAQFYSHLSDEGPAQALRQTMMSFIDDGQLMRRWSGLVLVGPGRPFSR